MNLEKIKQTSWIGDRELSCQPKALVLTFNGLGYSEFKTEASTTEKEWAKDGGLVVVPYYGPWCWMNNQERKFVDELVGDIFSKFSLPQSTPIIATGGSMGGCSALLYSLYSTRNIIGCSAIFPVCDLVYHLQERPDVPRSIHHAFRGKNLDSALLEHSPLHQVESMPRIPYLIAHGDADVDVNKNKHSDSFVSSMKELDHEVKYLEVPGMGHGEPLPELVELEMLTFVKNLLETVNH